MRMFTGDKAAGMVGSIAEVFPEAKYQRRTARFYRNALAKVPKSKHSQVAAMLKAIHAMKSREASAAKAESVAAELESMRLKEAAKVVREGFAKTLTYCEMPREHWRRIRTNNAIERLNREIRRRTRVVGTFPDGKSALMLVAARLKYVADSEWGSRRYLDVSLLKEQPYRRLAEFVQVPKRPGAATENPAESAPEQGARKHSSCNHRASAKLTVFNHKIARQPFPPQPPCAYHSGILNNLPSSPSSCKRSTISSS